MWCGRAKISRTYKNKYIPSDPQNNHRGSVSSASPPRVRSSIVRPSNLISHLTAPQMRLLAGPSVERHGFRGDSARESKWGPNGYRRATCSCRNSRAPYRKNAYPRGRSPSRPDTPNRSGPGQPTSHHTPTHIPLAAHTADATFVRFRSHS